MSNEKKVYEEFSDLYIELASLNQKYYSNLADEICREFIPKKAHLKILDIGTGPGYLPIEIILRRPFLEFHGVDLTYKSLEYGKDLSKKRSLQNIFFYLSDANNLPFKENSFDIIISTGAFHELKNPIIMLDECYRVLSSDGSCIIYDPVRIKMDLEELIYSPFQQKWKKYRHWKKEQKEPLIPKCYSLKKAESFIEESKFKITKFIERYKDKDYLKIVLKKDF